MVKSKNYQIESKTSREPGFLNKNTHKFFISKKVVPLA